MARLGVLVSGNGSNLQALIDARDAGTLRATLAVVISNKAGVPALGRAERAGIEAVCIPHRDFASREEFDARIVEELRRHEVDWVVFAGFMRLVTPVLLRAFEHRILNLHPSLLPAFPGVDAGKQALEHGVKVTGCTVHLVTAEMDSGPIIAQTPVSVLEDDDLDRLMQRIHAAEHQTLVRAVQAACEGRLELVPRGDGVRVRVRPA